jgi:GAF domain-containing protein
MTRVSSRTTDLVAPIGTPRPDEKTRTVEQSNTLERRGDIGRRRGDLSAEQQISLIKTMIAFGELSVSGDDPQRIFLRLLECAASLANGCEFSISVKDDDGAISVVASSSDIARLVTERQIEDNGPAAEVIRTGALTYGTHLSDQSPLGSPLSGLAGAVGFGALHVVPIKADGMTLGSLCVYDKNVRDLDCVRVDLLLALATASARALANMNSRQKLSALAEQLQTALNSRVIIEQAKGVVAARLALDPESAFTLLHRYARNHGKKLHDVCQEAVAGRLTGIQLREVGTRVRHGERATAHFEDSRR